MLGARGRGRSPSLAALLSFCGPPWTPLPSKRRIAALFALPAILLTPSARLSAAAGLVVFAARFADPSFSGLRSRWSCWRASSDSSPSGTPFSGATGTRRAASLRGRSSSPWPHDHRQSQRRRLSAAGDLRCLRASIRSQRAIEPDRPVDAPGRAWRLGRRRRRSWPFPLPPHPPKAIASRILFNRRRLRSTADGAPVRLDHGRQLRPQDEFRPDGQRAPRRAAFRSTTAGRSRSRSGINSLADIREERLGDFA